MSERVFIPHSDKQDSAVFSKKKITLCTTGIQWGKGQVGSWRTKMAVHEYCEEGMNHLIVAPSYKILTQATLPPFFKIMDGLGEYKSTDAYFQMYSGARIWCRTGTDPDSIVGITDVYSIWGDEAGLFSYYFYMNIMARSRIKGCPVTFTTSPYSYNWIAKELIKGVQSGTRDDVHWCHAASVENKYFPKEEFDAAKKTMPKHEFDRMYGGVFLKKAGLVYDCFDDAMNVTPSFSLPSGACVYAGIDWGFTQPFACTIVAALPGGSFVVVSEIYETRLGINDIIDILKQRRQIWSIRHFFAGPDQPGNILELNKAGLPCSAADNDVKLGIADVYDLIRSARLKFFDGACPHVLDEMENYHWPEDKELKPDQDEKDANPVKQDDHGLDSLRYVIRSIAHKGVEFKKGIKTPDDTASKRDNHVTESAADHIARLKKRAGNRKYEVFS